MFNMYQSVFLSRTNNYADKRGAVKFHDAIRIRKYGTTERGTREIKAKPHSLRWWGEPLQTFLDILPPAVPWYACQHKSSFSREDQAVIYLTLINVLPQVPKGRSHHKVYCKSHHFTAASPWLLQQMSSSPPRCNAKADQIVLLSTNIEQSMLYISWIKYPIKSVNTQLRGSSWAIQSTVTHTQPRLSCLKPLQFLPLFFDKNKLIPFLILRAEICFWTSLFLQSRSFFQFLG